MAIRFEYQPIGTGGLAAYAVGRGRARERGLKYAADLALRGQERRDRLNLIGQQQQFVRERDERQIDARFFENARQSEATLGRLKYAEMVAAERAEEAAKAAAERATEAGRGRLELETLEGVRRGELEIPPAAQQELDKLNAASVEALKLGPSELAEFQKRAAVKRRELLGTATPRTKSTDDEIVRQKLGSNYEQYKTLPWIVDNGKLSLPTGFKVPEDPAVAKGKADKEYGDDVVKRADQLAKEVDEETDKPTYPTRQEQLEAAKKIVDTDKAFFSGAPQPPPVEPTESYPSPAGGWEARRAYQQATGQQAGSAPAQPQAQPLPTDAPPGSVWIGADTIRLPDGRIVRRKKE